jgi:2-oxoisovalerate dehydrogenase E2 component (dihydrolipoyl transacylase)
MGVAPIKMPQLGESVTEGTVDKWLKKEGEYVKRDEPLVEVVTDKVNAEIPSPFEGKLVKITVPEGQTVAIGVEIAQIETEGAAAPSPAPPVESPEPAPETAVQTASAAPAAEAKAAAPVEGRPRFSPAVRRLAEEHGIDPSVIRGSGEGGRVTRDDVLAYIEQGGAARPTVEAPAATTAPAQAPAPAPAAPAPDGKREELVKLTAMRRSIAEHMVRSVQTAPHAWTMQEADVTELVHYRDAEKEGFRARNSIPLTFLPFVLQIVVEALKEHPYLNSTWTDDGILLKRYYNIGIAVALPDGLIVPVIKDADKLGFVDLARAAYDLAERARSKKLKPEDVQGGTFTLNNTGALGSVAGMPIINQPQAAILTTETVTRRPVVVGDGVSIRHMMNICMSFDHRIIDGLQASQFMHAIKERLENWSAAAIRI